MKLHGLRVLVTGASSGIGADLARALAASVEDVRIVLAARRAPELEALAAEVRARGASAAVVVADLSSTGGADALASAAVLPFGGIDVLINNAGSELVGPIWKEGIADRGEELVQLNFLAPMRLTHRLLPAMMERGHGAVVMMSSLAAWSPMPGGAYYAASKGALARASETLQIELRGSGVHVLAVYPGPVQTRMLDDIIAKSNGQSVMRGLPVGRPEELARRVLVALERDDEALFYPSLYEAGARFMSLSRWLMRLSTPKRRRGRGTGGTGGTGGAGGTSGTGGTSGAA